jgi:hypothetical protein
MRLAALAVLTSLCGCAHPAVQVEDMSNGQHSLTATSESGGVEGSREAAVERANAYCDRNGQQPVIASFYDHGPVGAQGQHTSTIIFSCAAPRVLHF